MLPGCEPQNNYYILQNLFLGGNRTRVMITSCVLDCLLEVYVNALKMFIQNATLSTFFQHSLCG